MPDTNFSLSLAGRPAALIASCLGDGDTGGGLMWYDGRSCDVLDDVSTTGLFVHDDTLVRVLWAPSQVATGTTILHYTTAGLWRHLSVSGLTDPHDVLWDGEHYLAVSSQENSILWLTAEGRITRRYQPAAAPDSWHLNCLAWSQGALYATAFGRFDEPRGWLEHRSAGSGMLFRVATEEDVLTGLCCPHSPRRYGSGWLLCSSATSELLMFEDGVPTPVARVQLRDWVRGLAVTDDLILVGESVNRVMSGDRRGATVAVIDRQSFQLLARLPLPYREVYDLVLVSRELLRGVREAGPPEYASRPRQLPSVGEQPQVPNEERDASEAVSDHGGV